MQVLQYAKTKLATPFMRQLLRRPGIFPVRRDLSLKYLRGRGVEFGAMNAPLEVAEGVAVQYADMVTAEQLRITFPDAPHIRGPDIISDLESMIGIDDISQDFVIANHVLEHVQNPIRAIASMARVLRKDGVAYITLPDKRFTFDKKREITPLSHLVRDYRDGPDGSLRDHYLDWAINVEGLVGAAVEPRTNQLFSERAEIHFHVWDEGSMRGMFALIAAEFPEISLSVEHSQFNRSEVIWILRKA